MRIERWAAGSRVERDSPAMTEYLFIEGEAQEGKLWYYSVFASCLFNVLCTLCASHNSFAVLCVRLLAITKVFERNMRSI